MKKIFLVFLLSFSLLFLASSVAYADLVPCGQTPSTMCQLKDIFILISNVYEFIVWNIATPLAGILVVIGGVTLIASAGNPNLASSAKKIIWGAIIGWLLIFCSWLIINTVFLALGLSGIPSIPSP